MRLIGALALVFILAGPSSALDPAAEALRKRFTQDESVLLSALLVDPQTASAFVRDGQTLPQEDFLALWRVRLVDFGNEYMSKTHATNLRAQSIKDVGEPGEWAVLMDSMRVHKGEWLTEYFRSEMIKADDELKTGNTKRAQWVVDKAREKYIGELKDYMATPAAIAAVARRGSLAQTETARRETERTALAQAEAARVAAERARVAPTPEEAVAQSGRVLDGGVVAPAPVVVTPIAEQPAPASAPLPTLPDSRSSVVGPVLGAPTAPAGLGVKPEPPAPSSAIDPDLAELRAGGTAKTSLFGNLSLVGGGLGAVIGLALGLIFGGPLLLMAAAGAALGFIGAKLAS